jgi:hypothetical protein
LSPVPSSSSSSSSSSLSWYSPDSPLNPPVWESNGVTLQIWVFRVNNYHVNHLNLESVITREIAYFYLSYLKVPWLKIYWGYTGGKVTFNVF